MTEYARELRTIAECAGCVQGRALAQFLLGEAELLSGRLDAAHQLLTSAVALYSRAGAASGQALAMHRLADVAVAAGRRTHAIGLLQHSLGVAEQCRLEPRAVVRLGVSSGTVRIHLQNIYNRLQVTNRTAAVTRAFPDRVAL